MIEALDLGKNIYKIISTQAYSGYEIAVYGEYVIWAGNDCWGVASTVEDAQDRLADMLDVSSASSIRIEL